MSAVPRRQTKEWHKSMTQGLRNQLVQKLIQGMFPTQDPTSLLRDHRMIKIIEYAKKFEGVTYETANSKAEYYHLLAEKLHRVNQHRRLIWENRRPDGSVVTAPRPGPLQQQPLRPPTQGTGMSVGSMQPRAAPPSTHQPVPEDLAPVYRSLGLPPPSQSQTPNQATLAAPQTFRGPGVELTSAGTSSTHLNHQGNLGSLNSLAGIPSQSSPTGPNAGIVSNSVETLPNSNPQEPSLTAVPQAQSKGWHKSMTPDLRTCLVQKMFQSIFHTQDPAAVMRDPQLAKLVQYAWTVEGAMYKTANSKVQYYRSVADKLLNMRKQIERLRLRLNGRPSGSSVTVTISGPQQQPLWPPTQAQSAQPEASTQNEGRSVEHKAGPPTSRLDTSVSDFRSLKLSTSGVVKATTASSSATAANYEDEDGQVCPICFEAWTNSGNHRLASLKCGHLFGQSCIERWLGQSGSTCPQCNVSANRMDIRVIYAKTLKVEDTADKDRALAALESERKARKAAELSLQAAIDENKRLMAEMERRGHRNGRGDGSVWMEY